MVIAYAARQPSWRTVLSSVFLIAVFIGFLYYMTFIRRRQSGFVISREMLCQCFVSTAIRSLVLPMTAAATSAAVLLTYQEPAGSIGAVVVVGFTVLHVVLFYLGFGLRAATPE
jgi:hypothetical protein